MFLCISLRWNSLKFPFYHTGNKHSRFQTGNANSGASFMAQWLKKKIHLQCRRHAFNLWVGKIPWRRKWQPTPVFLPGKTYGQRSLESYSPQGYKRVRHDLVTKKHKCKLYQTWISLFRWFLCKRVLILKWNSSQMSPNPWRPFYTSNSLFPLHKVSLTPAKAFLFHPLLLRCSKFQSICLTNILLRCSL